MALSMDEQRALAEIERRLAADDPGLATCLTAFRRPGPANVLRSPRARIIGSLFTVLLVAMVSLMVYAMIPVRAHGARPATPGGGTQTEFAISAGGTGGTRHSSPPASAHTSASATATAQGTSAAPSAGQSAGTGRAQSPASRAAGHVTSSAPSP